MSVIRKQGEPWARGWVLIWLCGGVVAALAQTNALPQSAPRRPNFVLIVADGLGYGELGCYGQPRIHTPRIDALVPDSVRFTDFHAGAGDDRVARAALLTGQVLESGLSSDVPTLAERLREAGYQTGFIGYWGLGSFGSANAAHRRGFSVFAGYDSRGHALNLYTEQLYRKDPQTGFEGSVPLVDNRALKKGVYVPDLLTQAATRYCKQNKPERLNGYRPFFLVVSYPVPAAVGGRSGPVPEAAPYAERNWPALQKAQANAITRFDQHVGEIADELQQRGMAQNTILLITSSLGPTRKEGFDPDYFKSTGAFRTDAGLLSEGRLRVPLLISWPFWMKSGRTSDLVVAGQDVAPTLLEAARLELPEQMDGISFLPTLQGQQQTNRHTSLRWTLADEEGATQRAVKQGKWKLIDHGADEPVELYDLAADPRERANIAEQNLEVVRELKALLIADAPGSASPDARPSN